MGDTLIYVTHIEDSMQCLQGPCLYFWGTHEHNLYLLMERFLERFRSYLERSFPPPSVDVLAGNGICCVLIAHQWYRARVASPKLDNSGKIEVLCIDNGKTHSVPLSSVRTFHTAIPGSIAENIRKWRPLSTKFILADVSAPIVPGCSNRQWSAAALAFLKKHVKNQTWKAALLGVHGEHQGVRLFDSNNQLLAKYLVERKLGAAAQTYKDAIIMCEEMKKSAANSRLSKICPTKVAVPPPVSSSSAPKVSIESSSKPHRSYLTKKLPEEGRHDVVVSNMANGPYKFVIRLTREEKAHRNLRKALDSLAPHPFPAYPKEGDPCIAVCPADKCFYRCLISAVDESGHQPLYTVYFVDTGFEYQLSLVFICDIPNELLILPPFAYQVSLAGVEEVAELSGLNEIFSSLVKSAGFLSTQVEDQHNVKLYDHTGRSFLDVLRAIKSNLLATILGVTTNSPNVVSSPTRLAEQVSKKKKVLAVDESLRATSPVQDIPPMETTDKLAVFDEVPDPDALKKSFLTNPKLDWILLMDLNFAPGQLMSSTAVASHVKSKEEVWLQLSLTAVNLLKEEIAKTDVLQLAPLEPEVGVHCLCFFQEDSGWYRAVVNCIQEARVSVTLIDYGVSTFADVADLRELPPSLAKQPGLALKCALDGSEMRYEISPTDEQCRSVIADAQLLSVVFVRQSTSHLFVRLFDFSTGIDLNEKMGLPERNLLDFSDLGDAKTSTASRAIPLINSIVTDPIEIDLFDRFLSDVSISPNTV